MTTVTSTLSSTSRSQELDRIGALVSDGRPKSRLETLCLERQISDLKRGHERGLIWRADAADNAVRFFRLLSHWEGPKAGTPIILEPWQEFWIRTLLGWYREDGTRRFRIGYVEIPRKNGKSILGSGLGLHGLIADGEPGAQVYSAATTRRQAGIVFEGAKKAMSPALRAKVKAKVYQHSILIGNSFFQPLASDNSSNHGWNIHRAIVDELHEHPSREVWDTLLTGRGARINPLIIGITTAGWDRGSICFENRQTLVRVLEGASRGEWINDSFFGYIATIDEGDDWTDPGCWHKANPNLNVSVTLAGLKEEAELALSSPEAANTFRQLHLNEWTESAVRFLPMERYDACDEAEPQEDREARLAGKAAYLGFDIGTVNDLTAATLLFPTDDGGFEVLAYCWTPKESPHRQAEAAKRQLMVWANRGYIRVNEGNEVDFEDVRRDIMRLNERFNIRALVYDSSFAAAFIQSLQGDGFPYAKLIKAGRGYRFYSEPTRKLLSLVNTGKLKHGQNPMLRWQMGNLAVKTGDDGDVRPSKNASGDKIDAAVACIYALAAAQEYVPRNTTASFILC